VTVADVPPLSALRVAIAAHPTTTRWILAGPLAVLAGLTTMMAMPLWFPAGNAGINDIAVPILLTPLLWAVPFLYACLSEDLFRCGLVLSSATLLQGALVALRLAG